MTGNPTFKTNELSEATLLDFANRVVTRYVKTGAVTLQEQEDYQMNLVERFLIKKDKIMASFEGKSNIKTYCYAVLNRMCCEMIRKEVRRNKHYSEDDFKSHYPAYSNASNQILIEDEIKLLEKIFILFDDDRYKVILFLKFMYNIPIKEGDLIKYNAQLSKHIKKLLLNSESQLTDAQKYSILQQLVNYAENKSVAPDAIRAWYKKILKQVIERLNGTLHRSYYNPESLGILLEYMFYRSLPKFKSPEYIPQQLKVNYA